MAKGDLPAEQNAQMQNELAWRLLTDKKLKDPDLKLAEKIAVRANEAAEGKQPAILDTLARAYFVNGKKDKAIEAQEKAIKLAEGDMKSNLEESLASYKKGELPKGQE
jgi:tetratricopeptide (TPR) repeat protein